MTVAELAGVLRSRLDECSPAERKVARVLLAGYPAVGFETVAVIAHRSGVSGPAVLRLLDRIGFRGSAGLPAGAAARARRPAGLAAGALRRA